MSKRRVVVTGMGAVTPLGNNVADTWQAAREGKCGIAGVTLYDTTDQKAKFAGEVKNFQPETVIDKREVRRMDRSAQFAVVAAHEAFASSGLDMEKEDPYRCGVIISSGIGGLITLEGECIKGNEKGFDRVSPFFIPMAISNMPPGHVAIAFGLKGMCSSVVTACASGTSAIGDGMRHIRDGYADVMLCGGTEATICRFGMGGFTSMKALYTGDDPTRASIPFDADRSGFVMGEGAGVLVLEEYEHAKKRGAKIYGEVVGYGATCDAHHITAPSPEGEGAARAMIDALNDAGIAPQSVGYINAHGTSTPLNDAGETNAVKTAFGDHAKKLAMSSTKSMTGHLLGAAGAVEAILSLCSMSSSYLLPTINYKNPDPVCDLDVIPNTGRQADVEYSMSNSLGFGGHNTCLVLKRGEEGIV